MSAKAVLGPRQYAIIALTIATAAIHFQLLFPDPIFILNALGFLTLMAVYFNWLPLPFLQGRRDLVRWVYIGFAVVTILAWVVMGDKAMILGWVTKAIEVCLVVALWLDRK